MANDVSTTVEELRETVRQFVSERDWEQFHTPKNLSMSLAIEVAELMEHFQWVSGAESQSLSAEQRVDVGEEMADVLCYLLALANSLNMDVSSTLLRKMEINREKYPADKFRGRFGESDSRPVTSGQ